MSDILKAVDFPKSTYMYWQKHADDPDPDEELKAIIMSIHKAHKNYGYRRIYGYMRKNGIIINIKKVHRLTKALGIQVTSFSRLSRKYNSYKGIGKASPNRIIADLTPVFHTRKSLLILLSLNTMK